MPELGSCTDITCDNEIKELYECYCCLRRVCLTHLIAHLEIIKQNKQQLDTICHKLNRVKNELKLIVEEKQLIINQELNLIEQAERFLDVRSISIDELQSLVEKVNQAVASNHPEEIIIKVEPSLSEAEYCSSVCKCNKENMNSDDAPKELKISKNNGSSMDINQDLVDTISVDETTKSTEAKRILSEQHLKEKHQVKSYTGCFEKCPLTFDGAYSLTTASHSIRLCAARTNGRVNLYMHLIRVHRFKKVYAKRLLQAVADGLDPRITKLFHENEDPIFRSCNVPCPFSYEQINSSKYTEQNLVIPSCGNRFVIYHSLGSHLRRYHKISDQLTQKILDDFIS
ncbi:unnamed protein product [Rotaria magnacalcarata]|uniref:Uncharacterized protein n=2 Tax=Rotaria magnacalcarata TaxID=392030 RepID=A0A816LXC0_9BILA|nr:unnamed protein product [Rotaria magnacalcarata]CAF1953994.1 unnamed protein product [Rotaria magnacalcarata]CAF3838330.1 unnamed protein product [Rotaria magnacalcarata]CAF3961529.1 unnamed protein product [Rotaria magnacalcarata]